MRRADPEQSAAFAQHDASRARTRAALAARPSNRSLDARDPIMPTGPKGRPRRKDKLT